MFTADLIVRAATFALAFAAAFAILARPSRPAAAPYAAFAVAGIGAFMVASAPGAHAALGLGAFFFNAWCLATPVAIWMLARVLFEEGAGVKPWHFVAAGVLVAFTMAGDYGRFRLGLVQQYPDAAHAMLVAGRVAALALLLAACVAAISHWRVDLVEERRRARAVFVAGIGSLFMAFAGSQVVLGGRPMPIEALLVGHGVLLVASFALLQAVARGGLEWLAPSPARPAPAPLAVVRADGTEAALARRVTEAMQERRLWKRERLGIAQLAAELGTQEYLLRRAINRHLGYRNFNDFLHDYRLQEAARRLTDAGEASLPVLSIALDCGYGSIGPFNRAFKARFGVTPTQYRHLRGPGSVAVSGIGTSSS